MLANHRRPRLLRAGIVLALLFAPSIGAAEHNPLLPRPRDIHYGSGALHLQGLEIRFASEPAVEDRFAAKTLARFLSERCGLAIPVGETRASAGAAEGEILLKRTGTGAVAALPAFGEQPGPDSREAYRVKVTAQGAEIEATSSAGLFYGVQTLGQLIEGQGSAALLPEVEIRDWPALAYRGVMIDLSHGPLPTEKEMERQLDFMARWKLNQYYFYNEASVELEGFSIVNPEGRFSKQEVRHLIAYARQRHIDIVPCLELYGHLHDLFRLERFADLSAVPHGSEFNPLRPEISTLLRNWVGQMADLFPSPFFHVGMDETWELEAFAQEKSAGQSPGKIYLDHFKSVTAMVSQYGKHVMVWADRFQKYPETIPDLPPGTILVPWAYGPRSDYKAHVAPFGPGHLPMMIGTGVTVWNQIAPDFDLSFDNNDTFLAIARPYNLIGHINTVWTDDAQVLLRSSFPGIAYGGAAGWQPTPGDRARFFDDYALLYYPDDVARDAARALTALSAAETHLQNATSRGTMHDFWADPLENLPRSRAHLDDLHRARLEAEDAQEGFDKALARGGDAATLSTFRLQARMIDYAAMKFLYAVEMADFWQKLGPHPKPQDVHFLLFAQINAQNHSRIEDLLDNVTELREDYRAAWLAEYTPYRLGTVLGKFQSEFEYWWNLQRRLNRFAGHFHDGDTLPAFESFAPKD